MALLRQQETETYQEVYNLLSVTYVDKDEDSPGALFCERFLDMVGAQRGTVLDAGCGAGAGALVLQEAGFTVAMTCDLIDVRTGAAQALPFVFETSFLPPSTTLLVAQFSFSFIPQLKKEWNLPLNCTAAVGSEFPGMHMLRACQKRSIMKKASP